MLGLGHVTNACRPLDADEVSRCNRITLGEPRAGRPMPVISESGLFKLTMRSDKLAAKRFQNWVTRTVLPAIRKDGMYVLGEEKVATKSTTTPELQPRACTLVALDHPVHPGQRQLDERHPVGAVRLLAGD